MYSLFFIVGCTTDDTSNKIEDSNQIPNVPEIQIEDIIYLSQ